MISDEIKETWKILNVEENNTLIMLNGLIKLILKYRGIDIKGLDKDCVDKLIEEINRE